MTTDNPISSSGAGKPARPAPVPATAEMSATGDPGFNIITLHVTLTMQPDDALDLSLRLTDQIMAIRRAQLSGGKP